MHRQDVKKAGKGKALRWVACGFAVAAVAVVASLAAILAFTDAGEERLRIVVLEMAGDAIEGDVGIERLEVRWMPLGLRLEGVSVAPPGGRLARAEAVEVSVDLLSLVGDEVRVQEVVVIRPDVELDVREGKIANVPRLVEGEGGRTVYVDSVVIVGGKVTAIVTDTAPWPVSVDLGNIDMDVTIERNEVFEVRLSAGTGDVALGEVSRSLDSLDARVTLSTTDSGLDVRVKTVELEMLDVKLSVEQGQLSMPAAGGQSARARFVFGVPLGPVHALAPRAPVMEGTLACSGDLVWEGGIPAVEGACNGRDVAMAGRRVGDLDARVLVDGARIALEGARLRQEAGELGFDGSLALDTGSWDIVVEADVRSVRLGALARAAGLEPPLASFTATGAVAVKGTLAPLDLSGNVDLLLSDVEAKMRAGKARIAAPDDALSVRTWFGVDAQKVVFAGGRVLSGGTLVRASGWVGYDGKLDVHVSSQRLDSRELVRLPGTVLVAVGGVDARVKGTVRHPVVTARVDLDRLDVSGLVLGKVSGALVYTHSKRTLELDGVTGLTGQSRWSMPGAVAVFRPARKGGLWVKGELVAQEVHIADLARMPALSGKLPAQMDATLVGEVTFEAEPQRVPAILNVDATATATGLTYRGQDLGTAVVDAAWQEGGLTIRTLTLDGGPARVNVTGTSDRDGALDLSVHVSELDAERITLADLRTPGITFVASLDAHVSGTLNEPVVDDGLLTVDDLVIEGHLLGDSAVQISFADGLLRTEGLVADGRLSLRTVTRTSDRYLTRVHVRFEDLVVDRALAGSVLPQDASARLTGTVDVGLHLLGGLDMEGKASLSSASFTASGYTLSSDGDLLLSFTDEKLEMDRVMLGGEGTAAELTGSVSRDGPDVGLTGHVDLALIEKLVEEITLVSGSVEPHVTVRGTWALPIVTGELDIDMKRLEMAGSPAVLSDVLGRAQFTKTGATLDAAGVVNDGMFSVSGTMQIEDGTPGAYSMDTDFNDLTLEVMGNTPVGLEGRLSLTGRVGADDLPLVTGEVWVTRFRYSKKFKLTSTAQFKGAAPAKNVNVYQHGGDHVKLDIFLHGHDNLKVKNNVLDVAFRLDDTTRPFVLTGTDTRPVVMGTVQIARGIVEWQNRIFEIDQGFVDFSNPAKIEPDFDIVAKGEIRDWSLTLRALGTPDDFRVLVEASPSLPEEDVVCLLAFEMTCQEAREGLGQAGVMGLSQLLVQFTPQQTFSIGSRYNPTTGKAEPVITIKKKLNSKVAVSALTSLGGDEAGGQNYLQAVVAYKVTDSMTVEGSYDNKGAESSSGIGNLGLDVAWKFEF